MAIVSLLQLTRCSPVHRHCQSSARRDERPGQGNETSMVYNITKCMSAVRWFSPHSARSLTCLTNETDTFQDTHYHVSRWSAITTSNTRRSAISLPGRSTAISRWNRSRPNRSAPSSATSSRDADRILLSCSNQIMIKNVNPKEVSMPRVYEQYLFMKWYKYRQYITNVDANDSIIVNEEIWSYHKMKKSFLVHPWSLFHDFYYFRGVGGWRLHFWDSWDGHPQWITADPVQLFLKDNEEL